MARAKKSPAVYYVHNNQCDNFFGPFATLAEARKQAEATFELEDNADDEEEVQVLQLIGRIVTPMDIKGTYVPV